MTTWQQAASPEIYQGQFGEFTITKGDRVGVIIYRAGLTIAAVSFAIATSLILWQGANPWVLQTLTILFAVFSLSLAVSLVTIHIYMVFLHRVLQLFWCIGTVTALIFVTQSQQPLLQFVYENPLTILGIGFTFAALTGIFFKEGFCFHRLETKFLTPLVPTLLLGHLTSLLPVTVEKGLLAIWAILFLIFALRKLTQAIPDDIGDKSVFEYLEQESKK